MKKRIFPLVIVATLLVGCSSSSADTYSSQVTDGDKNIITADGIEINKNEVYHYLLKQYGSSEVLTLALTYIADQEITDKDALKTKIDEKVASFTANLSTPLAEYAKQYGYDTEQEYIDNVLTLGVKQTMLQEKYIEKNYDDLVKEYNVKYLKVITLDTESAALSLIDQVKNGGDFDALLTENSGSDAGMVTTKSSNVDSKIISKLDKFTKDGIYNKVIKTSESKYAVVFVYNTDKKDLKDEIITNLASVSDMATKMEKYYLDAYNFEVYEEIIDTEIKDSYADNESTDK